MERISTCIFNGTEHILCLFVKYTSADLKLVQAFETQYGVRDMTTYMHIFIAHYSFFLEKYRGLEKLSNLALEAKHRQLKQIVQGSTSQWSGGWTGRQAEIVRQQMLYESRMRTHKKRKREKNAKEAVNAPLSASSIPVAHKQRPSFATKSLEVRPALAPYVKSSTIT